MLVAALDTATLTLSVALVELAPGAPPQTRRQRSVPTGRAKGQPDEAAPAPQGAPNEERGFAAGSDLERAGGPGGREPEPSVPPARLTHSAILPKALVDLLKEEGRAIPDVDGYAIGLGPGSFTGLRIGLATWKGLAYANRRPIAGASSLAAMALAAARDAPPGGVLVPLLDAKKGEVYAGFYRVHERGIVELAADAALPPAAVAARARDVAAAPFLAFGDGYDAYAQVLGPALPRLQTSVATPSAEALASLVGEALLAATYDAQALFALEPHYVRPSEAELKFPKGMPPAGGRGKEG